MSKEFKGTKGEWETQGFNGVGSCIDIIKSGKNPNTAPQIAQVYSLTETNYKEPQNEALKANAKLIAAAPDLLEALQVSVRALRLEGWTDKDGIIQRANAAISKALD
jgi:hypothetical protein